MPRKSLSSPKNPGRLTPNPLKLNSWTLSLRSTLTEASHDYWPGFISWRSWWGWVVSSSITCMILVVRAPGVQYGPPLRVGTFPTSGHLLGRISRVLSEKQAVFAYNQDDIRSTQSQAATKTFSLAYECGASLSAKRSKPPTDSSAAEPFGNG